MKEPCIILGNCQTRPLAFYLSYYVQEIEFIPFEIFALTDTERAQLNKLLENKEQLIITLNISGEKFDKLTTQNLRQKYKNLFTITNFYFKGLFPDIIYIGDTNNRVRSAALDYNSRIVFENFLNQRNIEDCISSFSYKTYENLGFFATYEASASELLKREELVDIKYAKEFLDSMKEIGTLFTVNHPCDVIFDGYARKIASTLGWRVSSNRFPATQYPNMLSWVSCALYEEIAEYHNIKYSYNKFYSAHKKILSLEEFSRKSYELYKNQFNIIIKNHIGMLENIDKNRYQIAKLVTNFYQAVMKRYPDYQGFVGMCNLLTQQGINTTSMTRLFENAIASPEFKQRFGILS